MWRNLKIRNKILIVIVFTAVSITSVCAYLTVVGIRRTLTQETFAKLTAVRELKSDQIEEYMRFIAEQIRTLSENRMIIDAMRAFKKGFYAFPDIDEAEQKAADSRLTDYYRESFVPRLSKNLGRQTVMNDFWPNNPTVRVLQDLYIASNPFETGNKHLLTAAGDGSFYTQTHRKYHPVIRNYSQRFGYYDIFLIDVKSGDIVYSVFKEIDFATSLLKGPFQNTNFSDAFRAAKMAEFRGFTRLVDFKPYDPSYGAYASFVAAPIFDGNSKIGVIAVQMPTKRINDIMTSNQAWASVGLGATGETYIVGSDFTLRNQSRFFVEDSQGYLNLLEKIGISPTVIDNIRHHESTIGEQQMKTKGTLEAFSGITGQSVFNDYRNVPVMSAYAPLKIDDLQWVIMSEIDQAEAFSSLYAILKNIMIGFFVLLALVVIVAIFLARSLTSPLRALTVQAQSLAAGDLDTEIEVLGTDEAGELAQSFRTMQENLRELVSRQKRTIDSLTNPMIPLHEKIVAVPLIGEIDRHRLESIQNVLSVGLHESNFKVAILDFTGVPSFNRELALALNKIFQTVVLLGVHVVITGMNPTVVRELAGTGLNIQNFETSRTLQMGFEYATAYIQNGT